MILLSNLKSIEGVDWMRALDLLIVEPENKLSILQSIKYTVEIVITHPVKTHDGHNTSSFSLPKVPI